MVNCRSKNRVLAHYPVLARAIKKVKQHVLPLFVIMFIVNYIDRVNIGFVRTHMEHDLGIGAAAYGFGAGIFFIGYALFEVPSNLLLRKVGAKIWLARIAITWGIVEASFALVQGETSFILLRFLLGVTEAGLFPGVIMYLAEWFPNKVRVQIFAIFYLAQPLSQMVGAPLSGMLINLGEKMPGIAGWQLMFLSEGLLAVLAGIAAFFFLINGPQDAKFLTPAEKAALQEVMALEDTVRSEERR